jgi:tetratricopeptide (TPR) repeat protein
MNDAAAYGTPQRAFLPARLWYRFKKFPNWLRWVLTLGLVVAIGGAVTFLVYRQQRNARNLERSSLHDRLRKAIAEGDEEGAKELIGNILAMDPNQPRIVLIDEVMTSGVAPADDPLLCSMTMNMHLKKPDYAAAAREARKRLAVEPNDWNARCTTITDALTRGERAEAEAELAKLPDPELAGPSATGLLWAYELHQRLGADLSRIRTFVNNTVVQILGTPRYESLPNPAKLDLVSCYLLGFDTGSTQRQQTQLRQGVAPAMMLLETVQRSSAADQPISLQVKLGDLLLRFGNALDILRIDDQLSEARHAELSADVQQRTLDVWARVQKTAPTEQRAYHAQAIVYIRQKRLQKAFEMIELGLTACDKCDSLVALNSVLYQGTGEPEKALTALVERVKVDRKNLNLWLMIAELGLTLQRPDLALAACEDASNLAGDSPVLQLVRIRAHLLRKDPHSAVQILTGLGETKRLASPAMTGAYIRCLCETGLTAGLDQQFQLIEKAVLDRSDPLLLAAAVVGVAEGPYDLERWASVDKRLARMLERFPGQKELLVSRAVLLFRATEQEAPNYDQIALGKTKVAIELARAANINELSLTAMLVWVQLKGFNQPTDALRAAEPLLLARNRGEGLTPEQNILLGACLAANNQLDEATKCFELALAHGTKLASVHVELAKIAQRRNDTAGLKQSVERAMRANRTKLDDIELRTLQPNPTRESP